MLCLFSHIPYYKSCSQSHIDLTNKILHIYQSLGPKCIGQLYKSYNNKNNLQVKQQPMQYPIQHVGLMHLQQ